MSRARSPIRREISEKTANWLLSKQPAAIREESVAEIYRAISPVRAVPSSPVKHTHHRAVSPRAHLSTHHRAASPVGRAIPLPASPRLGASPRSRGLSTPVPRPGRASPYKGVFDDSVEVLELETPIGLVKPSHKSVAVICPAANPIRSPIYDHMTRRTPSPVRGSYRF